MAGGNDDETAEGALSRTFIATMVGAVLFCGSMFFIFI
jgi:hypothetical protein